MSTKRMPPSHRQKPKEEVNKKAIVWIVAVFAVLVIGMTLLLVLSNG